MTTKLGRNSRRAKVMYVLTFSEIVAHVMKHWALRAGSLGNLRITTG
jgi:hypothetical protein